MTTARLRDRADGSGSQDRASRAYGEARRFAGFGAVFESSRNHRRAAKISAPARRLCCQRRVIFLSLSPRERAIWGRPPPAARSARTDGVGASTINELVISAQVETRNEAAVQGLVLRRALLTVRE